MHLNFKYWQKLKLCQSKVCNILKNSGLSIKKLRNLQFFRFGSLSVAYHAHKGLRASGFGLRAFGFWGFAFPPVWSFSRCQKKISEICKKLLTFPFRCAILEANNGFGVLALRSLLRKILTSPSEAFFPYAIFR